MNNRLSQAEFDTAAAAWAAFIGKATPTEVQALFVAGTAQEPQYQTYVSFDLAATIPLLLSTVGISRVLARFVLAPPAGPGELATTPRFRVVLYAADQLGGRISAYYQGDTVYQHIPTKPTHNLAGSGKDAVPPQSLVPFSLIRNWLNAWVTAVKATNPLQLSRALFATPYGPLQGYNFELGDFMDQLFVAEEDEKHKKHKITPTSLYLNFSLKTYYPAYSDTPLVPTQTFGLVVRLYTRGTQDPDQTSGAGGTDGSESGPSYDMAVPMPPG